MSQFSAIMEGAVTYLKMKDRKLTEKFLSLAVRDTFVPVLHSHFYQVFALLIHPDKCLFLDSSEFSKGP